MKCVLPSVALLAGKASYSDCVKILLPLKFNVQLPLWLAENEPIFTHA
jgi:hypothetical protein